MDDNQIKSIFENFNPRPASDDFDFLTRLERNMDRVDMVKKQIVALRRKSRRAAVWSAAAGFAAGAVLTTLVHLLVPALSAASLTWPSYPHIDWQIIGWITAAAASFLTSALTYRALRLAP